MILKLLGSSKKMIYRPNLKLIFTSYCSLCLRGSYFASSSPTLVPSLKTLTGSNTCSQATRGMGNTTATVKEFVSTAKTVCFDVDSTVINEEGIDAFAGFLGKEKEVAELTAQAMGGTLLFEDALKARLDILKPSKQDMMRFLSEKPFELSPGVKDVIDHLHAKGVLVYLVSGGFREMIEPVAESLSIPLHRIYANSIIYNNDGSYAGFDDKEPTSKDRGKPTVMQFLLDTHGADSVRPLIMIGDGATDLQARPPADAFIGYGGIVEREAVVNGADWFVKDFQEILDVLKSQ